MCDVVYLYDEALEEFDLQPSAQFPNEMVQQVKEEMALSIKIYILVDIAEKIGRQAVENNIPNPVSCGDRPVGSLSGSR
jgi:hypothetical protein